MVTNKRSFISHSIHSSILNINIYIGVRLFAWQRYFSHAAKEGRPLARSPSKEPL